MDKGGAVAGGATTDVVWGASATVIDIREAATMCGTLKDAVFVVVLRAWEKQCPAQPDCCCD